VQPRQRGREHSHRHGINGFATRAVPGAAVATNPVSPRRAACRNRPAIDIDQANPSRSRNPRVPGTLSVPQFQKPHPQTPQAQKTPVLGRGGYAVQQPRPASPRRCRRARLRRHATRGRWGQAFVDASQHTRARKGRPPIGGFATCQQARHRLTIPAFVGRLRIGRGFLSREGLGCVRGGPCTADTVGTSSHCCIALQHLVRFPLRLPRISSQCPVSALKLSLTAASPVAGLGRKAPLPAVDSSPALGQDRA